MLSKLMHRFNEILHNDRDRQELVVGGPNTRPTNPRWRTAAILQNQLNRHVYATFWSILMKFGSDAHWPLTADRSLKYQIFESPKSQKSRYLRNGLTDLYEIWYGDAKWGC